MNRGARRRWLLVILAVVVAGGAGATWITTRSPRGNPDPGGRILAGLQTVESAIPADAEVMLRQASEPRWDSCDGRAGTFGWDNVTVNVQFRETEKPDALVAHIDEVLTGAGWRRVEASGTPLGPTARWSRSLSGPTVATAALGPGTRGDGSGIYWELGATAPPQGQHVSGC
jgi:hypothetical protein